MIADLDDWSVFLHMLKIDYRPTKGTSATRRILQDLTFHTALARQLRLNEEAIEAYRAPYGFEDVCLIVEDLIENQRTLRTLRSRHYEYVLQEGERCALLRSLVNDSAAEVLEANTETFSEQRKQAFREIRLIDAQLRENYKHPFNGLVWRNHAVLRQLRKAAFERVRS